jgi:hypothetical protein
VRQQLEQEVGPLRHELQQEGERARELSRHEEHEEQQPIQQAEEQRVQVTSTEGLEPDLFCTWLSVTRRLVEQQTEQRLRSLLDTLFSESVRTTLQQQTEQKLRRSLHIGFETIVGGSAGSELQQDVEQTLEPLLQDAFEVLFAGPVRAEVQWHGEQVIQALLHGDFEAPREHAEQALQSLLRGTLRHLQLHAQQVEQLVLIILKVLLKASQGALGSRLKENLGTIATVLSESAQEKVPRNVDEMGAAPRERMAGAREGPALYSTTQ